MDEKSSVREGVICFLRKDESYLLAHIAYGDTDRKWNGIGGFVKEAESLPEAVQRIAREQISITLDEDALERVGKVVEYNDLILHIFIADTWSGTIAVVDDTIKQIRWFIAEEIPYEEMWQDNKYWLPEIVSGKTIIATVMRDVYTDIKPLTEKDVFVEEVGELE